MWGPAKAGGKGRAQKKAQPAVGRVVEESEEQLVAKIKALQKNDPVGKDQWTAFVDQYADGKRDPCKHPKELLSKFLRDFAAGTRLESEEDALQLPQVTKMLQKKYTAFKDQWSKYCKTNGGGTNDPLKHESSFHAQFYEHLAKRASGTTPPAMMMPAMGMGMGMGMDGGPPAKRMRTAMGMGMGMMTGDTVKDRLVAGIKAFQRESEDQKETWWNYADAELGGIRDPARHDTATLQQFAEAYGVEAQAPAMPTFPMMSPAMMGMGMVDPAKAQLVTRIKNYQRQGEGEKQAWWEYCGNTRDPARHDTAKLMEFIST
eukprot:CAMPEP_0117512672 /NCGR_PEP_ID=MMETSP0784-20121206/29154_1 /TAXON_ID=39447 /ORGANISM="" /LENGTH=316 /DNA_ID=CAMNT_0005308403 /DNA_START=60 /DNA_END=1006 /DNA_ORIENTATION=+